jgi:hypothetical protein
MSTIVQEKFILSKKVKSVAPTVVITEEKTIEENTTALSLFGETTVVVLETLIGNWFPETENNG